METIIQELRSGNNAAALKELYKGFPAVNSFIRTHGGNTDDARDLFQESLIIFYRNCQKSDFSLSCSPNTYVFAIVKNLWKDECRKRSRVVSFEAPEQEAADIESFRAEEAQMRTIDRVLAELGEKCSQILRLFYYKKMNMETIAQQLDYKNVDTAKTQKYKCLERARSMAGELLLSTLSEEL